MFGNAYLSTWPEVARRLNLIALCLDCNLECSEVMTRECDKVFQCLYGDGGCDTPLEAETRGATKCNQCIHI